MAPSVMAELSATIARELVEQARRRGAEVGASAPAIGVAIAAALVYYAREQRLADTAILAVVVSAMSMSLDGMRIGPVVVVDGGWLPKRGDRVVRRKPTCAEHMHEVGVITAFVDTPLPIVVDWPNGVSTAYTRDELRPLDKATSNPE